MQYTHLQKARLFARLMDNQFNFLGVRFGLDNLIGLIPGIGDVLSAIFSFYLIWIGVQMNLPSQLINKMVINLLLDTVIGSIPLIGDLGDIFFKANLKNLRILENYDSGEVLEGEVIQE
jgi:hypothetical protein